MALTLATLGSVQLYRKQVRQRLEGGSPTPALGPGRVIQSQHDSPHGTDEAPAEERSMEQLRVGDVVMEFDNDWLLVSTKEYREEDDRWSVHTLENGLQKRLLEVRQEERWTATFLRAVDDLPVFGNLLDGLTYQQTAYHVYVRGDAYVRSLREGTEHTMLVQYARYHGTDRSVLVIEKTGDDTIVYLGQPIDSHQLSFLPGAPIEPDGLTDLFS